MALRGILLGTAAVMVLAPLGAAYAQSDDIIVTARKRQENILQVPVQETVVTPEQLLDHQLTTVRDLAANVPGLHFDDSVLNNGTQVAIRGAGTSTLNAGIDQTVSLNLDGMQLSQGVAYRAGLLDVGQIEVLKGPQALFYGKSSTGGVISIRTADPTNELEIIGRASYGFESDEKRGELIVSGPLSEQLLVRLAAMYSHDDGYFKNVAVAAPGTGAVTPSTKDITSKNLILRGTVLFKPTSDFTARLKVNHTYDKVVGNGGEGQWANCPEGVRPPPVGIPFLGGNEDCKIDRKVNVVWASPIAFPKVPLGGVIGETARQTFGTLELNYDVTQAIALTSVTGYYHLRSNGILNGLASTFAAGPFFAGGGGFGRRDFTEELRIDTDFSGTLNFAGGLYYQDGNVFNKILTPGNTFFGLPAILGDQGEHKTDTKAYSAFGQLRWKAAPELEVAGGVRWTHDKRYYKATHIVAGQSVDLPVARDTLVSANFSPELTLTWTPSDDLTVFGSIKQAYKSGSFTAAGLPRVGEDIGFEEERVRGGEIGVKGRLADKQITFDLAGYYYKYKGLQVSGIDAPLPGEIRTPGGKILNAGGAEMYGMEFAVRYAPEQLEGLNLNAAVNYNHARFTEFSNAPCWGGQTIVQGCDQILDPSVPATLPGPPIVPNPAFPKYSAQDLAGGRLLRAPTWQINGGFDYTFDLSDTLDVKISSNSQYSSSYLNSLVDRFDTTTGAHFLTDLSVTLAQKDSAWEIAVGANNLTNKLVVRGCNTVNLEGAVFFAPTTSGHVTSGTGAAGIDELACRVNPGRQVWMRLTLRPNLL